jgi:hypothetical protein
MRCAAALLLAGLAAGAEPEPGSEADRLYRQGLRSDHAASLKSITYEVAATSDGRSYLLRWAPPAGQVRRWIVSLHGSRGHATDDLAIWRRNLGDAAYGLVCLQWWRGQGDRTEDYLRPQEIYRELDLYLIRAGLQPGSCVLHGFSRGSANLYPVMALDRVRGRRFFPTCIASSGGVGLDYPPVREVEAGIFGPQPFAGTRWITCAGGTDPDPDRDGIPAMRRTAAWIAAKGGTVVLAIEDAALGHGALQLSRANVAGVLRVLDRNQADGQPDPAGR